MENSEKMVKRIQWITQVAGFLIVIVTSAALHFYRVMWMPGREQLLNSLVIAIARGDSEAISSLVEDQSSAIELVRSRGLISSRYSLESADYELPEPFVTATVMFSNRQLLTVEMVLSRFDWRIISAEFSDACIREPLVPGCDGADRRRWQELSISVSDQ
jgi:hypothetical protein